MGLPFITGKELNFEMACKFSVRSELYAAQVGTNFSRACWLFIILQTISCLRNTSRVIVSKVYKNYSTFSFFGSGQNKSGYKTAFDQINFTTLNFFRIPFFVVELRLHLLDRWPSQCHVVFPRHLVYKFVNQCYQLQRKQS